MKTFDTAQPDEPPIPAGSIRRAAGSGRRRPPFGSYMDPDLQKRLKVWCVTNDIEIQDALDEAVRTWLDNQTS
ncbi:hypothetical protein [Streptomyces niveus]|uniref:hypothetical protein n=1 Tax=Streptomyces niveus TaxID=193462 RepID=UPI00343EC719